MGMLNEVAKLIPIHKEANHGVVHQHRLRKANRLTSQPLDASTQRQMFALDLLRLALTHRVVDCGEVPFVDASAIGIKVDNPKGLEQGLQLLKVNKLRRTVEKGWQ